jgi:hypothetical protein
MTLQEIQVSFQALSSVCIAGSFIYGAIQFRNLKKAQHVANYTRLVEMQMALRRMRVDDPSLATVFRHDVEGLASDHDIREYFFALMQLSVFEIVWFSHKNGGIPDDYYDSWSERMKAIALEPSFQRMFKNPAMKILHDDFQKYITDMITNLPTSNMRND